MAASHDELDEKRTLYGFWLSPYMSMVAQMLKESGLDFRYERVSPYVGGTVGEQHRAKNPLGKIPTLADTNGALISESQAICRYLARTYPAASRYYPCDDPLRCAEVDELNDFIAFSISGPFASWFTVSGYFPKAFGAKTEHESRIFSTWSMLLVRGALARLGSSARWQPFLLGQAPCLPDFQLFHVLELSRTFSQLLDIPTMNLLDGDERMQRFHDAMAARPATKEILAAQAQEFPTSRQELFQDFGPAYDKMLKPGRKILSAMFGHDV
jgi:glutathione S-transferase